MRTVLAALMIMVWGFSAPAVAGAYQDKDGRWWDMPMPLDHWLLDPIPSRMPKDFSVSLLPRTLVHNLCKFKTGKAGQFGCAYPDGDICQVIIAEDVPRRFREAIQIHEVAHCPHGWPADHPQY